MHARDPISHAPLQARHEGHAPRLQLMEPLKVKIRAVRHDHAAGWKRPGAGDLDVAGLALGHTDEARQMARLIQPDVQLDRGLRASKGRPREDRQTQIDGRRIDRVQLVLEPKAVPRRALLTAAQQASEQRLVEGVRLLGIDARQRGATDRRPYAQVIELAPLGAQVAHDVTQALSARQLRQAKGHELRPAAHDAQPLTSLVLAGLGFEFMSRKEPEKLHEDCVMMSRGLDLLSFE